MIFSIESALTAEKRALWRNPLFQMATQPKAVYSLLFSRYEASISYQIRLIGHHKESGEK